MIPSFHSVLDSSGFGSIGCLYSRNPSSANLLCQLWCRIQLFQGNKKQILCGPSTKREDDLVGGGGGGGGAGRVERVWGE